MSPNVKLLIYFILAALPSYLIRFSLGPIPFTLLEILVLITIISFGFSRRPFSIPHSPFSIPILLLLLAATIGVLVAPDHLAALGIWKSYFIEPILFFFVAKCVLTNDLDKQRALEALGLGALLMSIFAIVQYVSGWGIPIPWDWQRRVTSFFPYPNAVGLYLAPIVTIAILSLFEKTEKRKIRLYWLLVTTLGLVAIILAKTEAALVAIPASVFICLLLKAWTSKSHVELRRPRTLAAISFGILLLAIALSITPIREKLLLQDASGLVRRSQWSETAEMLKDRWFLGAGLSGYPSALEPYHTDRQYEIFQYPHNIVLNIWSELGLLGLLAFVVLAFQTIKIFLNSTTQRLNDSMTIIIAALLTMTIHGLVDVPYFKNDLTVMTWSLLALLL